MSDTTNPAGEANITVVRDSSTPVSDAEYDRFEALARRIVKVSKAELDEQRKAEFLT